ncbi:MAG: DNA repair protein RecN [Candidatus Eremiobacterota bacterium]
MLKEIHISDFTLMDNLNISFYPGFNVFTGETGAGKSNLMDAISVVLGQRAREDYIRSGREQAFVEALFDISSNDFARQILSLNGFDESDELLISRTISRKGKNVCRVNGRLVTTSILSEFASTLIELQGQHENQSLFVVSKHLDILDDFGALSSMKEDISRKYREIRDIKGEIDRLRNNDREHAQRMDFLKFEISEIEEAKPVEGEEEELLKEKLFLSNIEKISRVLSEIFFITDGDRGFCELSDSILSHLNDASSMDENLKSSYERFENIYYELTDLVSFLRHYTDGLEFNPERLEEVINRLSIIGKLKRKYGNSISEILTYLEQAKIELAGLCNSDVKLEKLEMMEKELREKLLKNMIKLSEKRKKSAGALEKTVNKELNDIGMGNARLKVAFLCEENPRETRMTEKGIDNIEFLFSANPGEPLKPLARIASGGEISRVMLSLKSALAKVKTISTLVFDEVDTGLGGEAAGKVGIKLHSLSSAYQVICVTHLPQIASIADTHFLLYKSDTGGRVVSLIKELHGEDRIMEISRMLEGEERSRASRELAVEMLGNRI